MVHAQERRGEAGVGGLGSFVEIWGPPSAKQNKGAGEVP
jgi:hypothetical protein